MIYTSYFGKLKEIEDKYVVISICGKAPDWYKGLQYKKLAPKYAFFMEWKQNQDNEYYIKHYNAEVLSTLSAKNVAEELRSLANSDKDIVLLCYEKPSDFCHRHLVAKWFREHGIDCKELMFE
jgi:uncharacterized protein YeaO (DUF488 family)